MVGIRKARTTGIGALAALLVVGIGGPVPVGAARAPGGRATCRAPRLRDLTLEVARRRAARAGCELRVKGSRLQEASTQTVARQSPPHGRRSVRVTVWLNPLCHGMAAHGPAIKEPRLSAGPTELVSGFYLDGGKLVRFSTPKCRRAAPPPGAGTAEVLTASGALVASRTSAQGHFVKIALPAGSYTIRGTFLSAEINGAHPTRTESVVIPSGHTVRQDFFLSIR